MKIVLSSPALEASKRAPTAVRKAFYKQLDLLAANFHHPSLRAKKYHETTELWQAPVNRDWRFYFQLRGDVCVILDLIPHPK